MKPVADNDSGRKQALAGRQALVIGAARSGTAVARLLLELGARVTLADRRAERLAADPVPELVARGLETAPGRDDPALVAGCDLLVVSPGVPLTHPAVRAALARGVEVSGELDLAAALSRAPLICVTGTDGKSTTVELIGALLRAAGREAPVVGNIGRPLAARVLRAKPQEILVVEVSSFQLETARRLAPRVAVLLNVATDHLDRHGDLATYVRLKLRLFGNQTGGDDAVMPADWDGPPAPGNGRRLAFGLDAQQVETGATVCGDWLVVRNGGREQRLLPVERLGLRGEHNLRNVLAALAAIERYELDPEGTAEMLHRFTGLPHRLERVAVIGGVTFVNDSKATNVHAMRAAVASFDGGIHLLAGGRDKGGDFETLAGLVAARVRRVYGFGEAAARIRAAWPQIAGETLPALADAVHAAAARARRGEVVLLAPGCTSFDAFRDYEERGDAFRRLVLALAATVEEEAAGGAGEPPGGRPS